MLNITTGKVPRAVKVVLYGPEGIGKTTLASQFPDPLFIDTEGGTAHLDVRRVQKPDTWKGLLAIVEEVAKTPGVCKSLVIDTADWAEQICTEYVCVKNNKDGIESFGYGKGYKYLSEEFMRLLIACDKVIDSGKNIIITAHAQTKKFELPDEMGAYDQWTMKLSKHVYPLVKEWADMVLFLNYKTYVVTTDTGSKKAQGGKRVMYATHHPCWEAKNRFGLPDEMDMSYEPIGAVIGHQKAAESTGSAGDTGIPPEADDTPVARLRGLLKDSGFTEAQLRHVVAQRGKYPEETPIDEYPENFVVGWCIAHFDKITAMIKED